jgi:hypothetical protein
MVLPFSVSKLLNNTKASVILKLRLLYSYSYYFGDFVIFFINVIVFRCFS